MAHHKPMTKTNFFQDPKRAANYDRVRPSFHREALKSFHQIEPKEIYHRVLDIGCGTGQSSLALTDWAHTVEALDQSQAMLSHATNHEKVHYHLGDAEALPFSDHYFDLVFVASSLHWFKRRLFLKEVSRVLKTGGVLLIYQSTISSGLSPHFYGEFNRRYPPPHLEHELKSEELSLFQLSDKKISNYSFPSTLNEEGVVLYLEGLSNIGAKLEEGMREEEIQKDLTELVKTHSLKGTFNFNVQLISIKKEG